MNCDVQVFHLFVGGDCDLRFDSSPNRRRVLAEITHSLPEVLIIDSNLPCLLTLHSQVHNRTRRLPAIVAGETRVISRVVASYALQHQALGTHDDTGGIVLRQHAALSLMD